MTSPAAPVRIRDRAVIERFLRRDAALHVYELGDLDDAYWPDTDWFGLGTEDDPEELVLCYTGLDLPVLVALTRRPGGRMPGLLAGTAGSLPARLYAHLSIGLVEALRGRYAARSHGVHLKMALADRSRLDRFDRSAPVRLTVDDLAELRRFYDASYPGHWFEPRMLEAGGYFGIRLGGRLVSVAGVHVYAPGYRTAALGNVATAPEHRNRGLAASCCARLCTELLRTCDNIGLNVRARDPAAVGLYRRLGFEPVGEYEEFMLERPA